MKTTSKVLQRDSYTAESTSKVIQNDANSTTKEPQQASVDPESAFKTLKLHKPIAVRERYVKLTQHNTVLMYLNTGVCLIEVTVWTGLTVFV